MKNNFIQSAAGRGVAWLALVLLLAPATGNCAAALATTPAATGVTAKAFSEARGAGFRSALIRNHGAYGIELGAKALAAEPAAPQPTVAAASATVSTVRITATGGTGAKRLVVLRPTAAAVAPADGSTYAASPAYGSATAAGGMGPDNYVVLAGASTAAFTVTGLGIGTSYTVDVYAYNDEGTAGTENYLAASPGTATFVTLVPAVSTAQAGTLLLEDDFNAAAGTLLTVNGWTAHSDTGIEPITVAAGSVSFGEYPAGTPANNNKAAASGTGEDVNRTFARASSVGATALYVSAVINVNTVGTDFFLHLMDNTQPSTNVVFRGKLFTRASGAGFNFGVSVSESSSAATPTGTAYASTVYNTSQNYLVVLKYVTNAGGTDQVSLFVLDAAAPTEEPATPTIGPLSEANSIAANSLNAVALRQGNTTPKYTLDGLRVGTGWGSAVGKPYFSAPAATLNTGNYYSVTADNADFVAVAAGSAHVENILTLTSGKITTNATNILTLYQPVTVAGGNDASYVNGPVARVIGVLTANADFAFPVGKASAYRPLYIRLTQNTARTYTAEQIEGNPGGTLAGFDFFSNPNPLKRLSRVRSYAFTSSTTAGTASGAVTLTFGADDNVTDPFEASGIVIGARTPTVLANKWTNRGWRAGNYLGTSGPYVVGNVQSDFFDVKGALTADFAIGSTNTNVAINPLPVELSSFTAQRQGDKLVAVNWATASEKNSAYFEVQRSGDGVEFATVVTVAAQGHSSKTTSYAALDPAAPAGTLYYRLRQVDRDGTVAYSPLASVAGGKPALALHPNPAQGAL